MKLKLCDIFQLLGSICIEIRVWRKKMAIQIWNVGRLAFGYWVYLEKHLSEI